MIHMLSRFDLTPGTTIEAFRTAYEQLVEDMRSEGLVVSSGSIGRREADTPMDTDDAEAPEYYAVMSFEGRRQLDDAYAYLARPDIHNDAHAAIHRAVVNAVFTCWRDLD
jgi:hypothetical protein